MLRERHWFLFLKWNALFYCEYSSKRPTPPRETYNRGTWLAVKCKRRHNAIIPPTIDSNLMSRPPPSTANCASNRRRCGRPQFPTRLPSVPNTTVALDPSSQSHSRPRSPISRWPTFLAMSRWPWFNFNTFLPSNYYPTCFIKHGRPM